MLASTYFLGSLFGTAIPDVWATRIGFITAVLGVLVAVTTLIYKVVQVHSLIEDVQRSARVSEHQLNNNGGETVKDAVDRIEQRFERMNDRMEIQFDASSDRQTRLAQRLGRVEQSVRAGEAAMKAGEKALRDIHECTKKTAAHEAARTNG
jgi:gas vesicle protein